jgi:RNA polymerase sigma factor (sigma-70 family)
MLIVSSYPSFASRLTQTVIAIALFSSVLWMTTADAGPLSIALRGARAFPESITSARDGTLFIGRLGDGGIIRANPRTGKASLFVAPGASGSRSITGVFADDAFKTPWACSNDLSALGGNSGGRDHGSALKGFDLRTSAPTLSVPLPGPNAFCNDIAVDARGAVYVTDSAAPTVLRLPARASTFEVFASNPQFLPPKVGSAGLDGIAFGGDGNLMYPLTAHPTSRPTTSSAPQQNASQPNASMNRARSSHDDHARFASLVLPHLGDAYSLARWITGSRTDAEDVVQEACLRAFRAIGGLADGSARPWVLTIVRNTAYTWLRKNRPSAVLVVEDLEAVETAQAILGHSEGETPETTVIAEVETAQLEAAIAALQTPYRETIVLRDIQGLSYHEIGEVTGVPIGTVMSRLARARGTLIASMTKNEARPH